VVGDPEANVIWLLGVCHRRAPAAVRERVAYEPAAVQHLLAALRNTMPRVEALVVSTCNRTEAYLAGPPSVDLPGAFVALHDELWPGSAQRYEIMLDRVRRDDDAVEHLARIACGLESSIVGDHQILGQLRRAVSAASDAGTLGRWLGTASAIALRAGRRVRASDEREPARRGIASAAADAIARHCAFRGLTKPTVLLLGAGTMGTALAEELTRGLDARLRIATRSAVRAEALAARVGAEALEWDAWPLDAPTAQVVVCATAARFPVLRRAHLEGVSQHDGGRLVVDLGLPRNVDPAVRAVADALVTLDDLANDGIDADIPHREEAVAEAVAEWREWSGGLGVEGVVRALYGDVDKTITATVAELLRTTRDATAVERAVRRHLRTLLDGHVRRLRADARDLDRRGPTDQLVACNTDRGIETRMCPQ
jgi:glutamyl-tRNA reductase